MILQDENGCISASEIRFVLSQISNEAEFETNEIDELIKYFDINENGKIEFTNFWELMNKTI